MPETATPVHRRRPRVAEVAALLLPVLAVVLAVGGGRPARAAHVSPEEVDASIKKGVAYIYSQQKPGGQWEKDAKRVGTEQDYANQQGGTFGGYTALCVFALLEAGEKPSDPRLVRAINFLKACDMYGVYAVGIRAMVWSRLQQTPEVKALLQKDVNRLVAGIIREGDAIGMWDYDSGKPGPPPAGSGRPIDHSISQFGVLGLWAGVQAGATVAPETWRLFDTVWRNHQLADGSWDYAGNGKGDNSGYASMTAAGTATLLIVQDVLGGLGGAGGSVVPAGTDAAINRGLDRLAKQFEQVEDRGGYAWYGVERIGTAGGFRYVGPVDWYDLGARHMIATQRPDGSWKGGEVADAFPYVDTAFRVLFLAHGRNPVLIHKLNYSAVVDGVARDAAWNERPRDAANLTKFTGHQLEQAFNWQSVSLAATAEDLLDAPVMLMAGGKQVVLLERERAKLKEFLDAGGLVLAVGEAAPKGGVVGSDDFSTSLVALGKQLYPHLKFRELPPTHPIFTDQQFKATRWTTARPVLWGLSNGVRELVVLIPHGDFGRAWSANNTKGEPAKFEAGANVVQYAMSRQPKATKGYGHVLTPRFWTDPATRPVSADGRPPSAPTTAPATAPTRPASRSTMELPADAKFLTVGRLVLGDNWDPEPGAWPRLTTLLANDHRLFVDVRPVYADDRWLAGVKLLHWTGTTAVKLTPAQRSALTGFVAKGGTLLVDAAGGSAAFADSAEAELRAAFGGGAGKEFGTILAADDPLYRLREGRIDKVTYRRYMSGRTSGALDAPRLRGLDQGGRTTVFFSREDLTAGCVGQNTDGILGYSPQSATAIVRNVVLTVSKRK